MLFDMGHRFLKGRKSMQGRKPARFVLETAKANAYGKFDDFADYVEKQVNSMELSGWLQESKHLRRWASELRGKFQRSNSA